MDHTSASDRSPALAELFDDAFVVPVDVETAARHLWAIHREARLREELASLEVALVAARPRRVPRAAVPMLAILMVMSTSGVAVAASGESVPGDVLYAVKRGTERAQLIFERDPISRAELQLQFAEERLDEIKLIATTRPQHVPGLVEEIVVTLDQVDKAPPEVAAHVQPHSQRVRQQTSAELSQLPAEVSQEAQTVMAATEAAIAATATPTPGEPTATPVPTAGGTAVAATDPDHPGGQPRPTATPTPTPTGDPTPASSTDEGGGKVLDGGLLDGIDATPSESPSPTPTPAPSASAGPAGPASSGGSTGPEPATSPSEEEDGPIITARPQPSEEEGESRTGDEETDQQATDDQPIGVDSEDAATDPDPAPAPPPAEDDAADGDDTADDGDDTSASAAGAGTPQPAPSGPTFQTRPTG